MQEVKVEVGQVWKLHGINKVVCVSKMFPRGWHLIDTSGHTYRDIDAMFMLLDWSESKREFDPNNYIMRGDVELISTHPDMYAAIAEMGRLVKEGE